MTEDKKIFATPKVRKFARELGANVSQIKGTGNLITFTERRRILFRKQYYRVTLSD